MPESKLKILFSALFYFIICATLLYNFQYIADVILYEDAGWDLVNVTAVKFMIIGMTSFICTYFFIKWQGIQLESLALHRNPTKIAAYIILGGFLGMLALLTTAVIELGGDAIGAEVAKRRSEEYPASELLLLVAFQLLFVGPGEELIFRGYLQGEAEKALDPFKAILFSACAFGLIHVLFFVSINPESAMIIFVSSTIAGLGFAYARRVSNNLAFPIALHGFWNALAFILNIEYVWGYDPKAVGFVEFLIETGATMAGIGVIILATYLFAQYTTIFQDNKPARPSSATSEQITN